MSNTSSNRISAPSHISPHQFAETLGCSHDRVRSVHTHLFGYNQRGAEKHQNDNMVNDKKEQKLGGGNSLLGEFFRNILNKIRLHYLYGNYNEKHESRREQSLGLQSPPPLERIAPRYRQNQ